MMSKPAIKNVLVLIIVMVIVLNGCTDSNKVSQENQISLQFDSTLVGDFRIDSVVKIQYAPPTEWNAINDSIKQIAFSELDTKLRSLDITLDVIYIDSLFQNIMTVSYLHPYKNYDSLYKEIYFGNSDIKENEHVRISNNGLILNQFATTDNQRNYFKILLKNKQEEYLLQIDYILSKPNIDSVEMRKIESSIASFHLFTN